MPLKINEDDPDFHLLAAYRLAWSLLSLKQKQTVYKAMQTLPNWDYSKNLIIQDARRIRE